MNSSDLYKKHKPLHRENLLKFWTFYVKRKGNVLELGIMRNFKADNYYKVIYFPII